MKKNILVLLLLIGNGNIFSQYSKNYIAGFNGTSSYIAAQWHSEINPTSAITIEAWIYPEALPISSCIVGKNYLTSYYFGIESTGRIVILPKGGGAFLRSRVTGVVQLNKWTHIAATYDGTTTRIFINGFQDTSTNSITGVIGTNFDSLYIGCDRSGGARAYFFQGKMENVRIWRNARTQAEISSHMFIPLNIYQQEGIYSTLAASYQMDNSGEDNSGAASNPGFTRNITFINYTDKATNLIDYNNNLYFNGSTDYCSTYNFGDAFDVTNAATIECWVKRDTTGTQPGTQNLINKSGGTNRYDYALFLTSSGQVYFAINSGTFSVVTPAILTNGQWTHIAAVYSSYTGKAILYVNGDSAATATFSGSPVINNNTTDTLYFGGIGASAYSANKFKGQLDEARIWKHARTNQQIRNNMYKHASTEQFVIDSLLCFDFDNIQSGFVSGANTYTALMKLLGVTYINSSHATNTRSTSPMLSDPSAGFYGSNYTTSFRRFFVPDGNTTGITDSIFIAGGAPVNNLKLFLLMNHSYTNDIKASLTSPAGTTINLLANKGGVANDIMTQFSDGADSLSSADFNTFNGPGITPPFSPGIKPDQPLSTFNGENRAGWWKLKFVDQDGADIGYISGWGLNLLPQKTLRLTALIQGFYNNVTDKIISDTVTVLARIPLPPYPVFDSAKAVLDSTGKSNFYFTKVSNFTAYYLVLKHRNMIDTWSAAGNPFNNDTASYDFTNAITKAYGSNQIQVDSSPLRFAAYNCDANKDGFIDAMDIVMVNNDALILNSGYLPTDMNGDDFVDADDVVMTYNNSLILVGVVAP